MFNIVVHKVAATI